MDMEIDSPERGPSENTQLNTLQQGQRLQQTNKPDKGAFAMQSAALRDKTEFVQCNKTTLTAAGAFGAPSKDKENVGKQVTDAGSKPPGKQPVRRSINNSEEMQKLLSQFGRLEEEVLQLTTQPYSRRDSLIGRANPASGAHQELPVKGTAPAPSQSLPLAVGSLNSFTATGLQSLAPKVAAQPLAPASILSTFQHPPSRPAQNPSVAPVSLLLTSQPPSTTISSQQLTTQEEANTLQAASNTCSQACFNDSNTAGKGLEKEMSFQFPLGYKETKVGQGAADVFEDPVLLKICNEGILAQLTRTKDGATEELRIQELADIAKKLRRATRELGGRAAVYVERCMRIERELLQQIESVQLSSQARIRDLEVELASVRQSLAQFEKDFKTEKAGWGNDLEMQKSEVSRLRRELERYVEERDKARDESHRVEQLKTQVEVELKELRKQAHQQMREATMSQSEQVRALTEDRIAAENKASGLQDENLRLSTTLQAAEACVAEFEQELHMMKAMVQELRGNLDAKEDTVRMYFEQIEKLEVGVSEYKAQVASLSADKSALEQELGECKQECSELQAAVADRDGQLQDIHAKMDRLQALYESHQEQWAEEKASILGTHATVTQERDVLATEKAALKTAVAKTLQMKEGLETELAEVRRTAALLTKENSNLKNEVEFVTGQREEVEERLGAAQKQLATTQSSLESVSTQLQQKDTRLEQLEGEFAALKEVLGDADQKDVVNNLLKKISTLQTAVAAAEATRRKLHNELVEVKGNIRVFCRVRPHPNSVVNCMPDKANVTITAEGKDTSFSYDRVFGPTSSQEEVFGAVSELVQSALDGYHVCLFSYGQTGAGKTHTMQGGSTSASRGIIPRAIEKILETAAKLQEQEWEYTMEGSFIEIYNNMLRDLLSNSGYINDQNAVKHDPAGGHTTVAGVSRVPVTHADQAAELVQRAAAARACQATAMNAVSSRSHSVFMLYITGWHAPTETRLQGCLCLVDLAGSERLDRSLVEDQRKKEACAINQSLSSLGDVFAALASKSQHVPYRNSKLTYLLQPCLGGHGKTLMFVNINPEPASANESLCSLRFATKVNGCETGAKGGAKRNVMTGASDDAAKRLSMPGPQRKDSLAPSDPAAKRMSMSGLPKPGNAASSVGTGVKRPAGSMLPLAGNLTKKTKL